MDRSQEEVPFGLPAFSLFRLAKIRTTNPGDSPRAIREREDGVSGTPSRLLTSSQRRVRWWVLMSMYRFLFACCWIVSLAIGVPLDLEAQEKKEKGSSLGDLFSKVKDIKVPDNVTNLPAQLSELKASYLETAKAVQELREEVEKLKGEVASLKVENAELRSKGEGEIQTASRADLLKPIELTATELAGAYIDDRKSADDRYKGRYLKLYGIVSRFETGADIGVILDAEGTDTGIRCLIKKDSSFYVDVMPTQGRIVSGNDRRTLLSVGQPVAVFGTCTGLGLNIEIANARIDGIQEKRIIKTEKK